MFYDILKQKKKTPLCAIKSKSSKSKKIVIFSNGLVHGVGPKLAVFRSFYFRKYKLI